MEVMLAMRTHARALVCSRFNHTGFKDTGASRRHSGQGHGGMVLLPFFVDAILGLVANCLLHSMRPNPAPPPIQFES